MNKKKKERRKKKVGTRSRRKSMFPERDAFSTFPIIIYKHGSDWATSLRKWMMLVIDAQFHKKNYLVICMHAY